MEYQRLFSTLAAHNVRYLLCGGLAVNIYGVPRMTADIDLLLDFTEENLDAFGCVMKELQYEPIIPLPLIVLANSNERLRLVKEKNLIAYSFSNRQSGHMSLDVLVKYPIDFNDLWTRKEQRSADGYMINLISLEDLIILKEYAGRSQDKDDVLMLNRFRKK